MGIYYTNQKIEAYKKFEEKGFLTGDEAFVDSDFLSAYKWLIEQMNNKINNDGSFPVWLWTEKPNLNEEGHFDPGTKAVCLTVEIPDEQILFSDFDAWHCVLNNWYCALTELEDDSFDRGKVDITKEESWQRIFNFEQLQQSEMWGNAEQTLQGVTPVIKKEQVLNVEYFTAQ
ncbi:DUF3841 domain-containing protein [Bacillus toyonensis]|uniref:DUF3841 domain-containing protein n=1 Tax=Bacillus toyonensis TaxID=155322 RepID=UPI002E1BEC8D|nr:DUF3841 domain-containing protein [Bacillus toyonensis]